MGCSRVAAIAGSVIWALITLMGIELISGVTAQHAQGYPSAGQLRYYVYFPAMMTGIALALVALLSLRRVPLPIKVIAAGATVLIFLAIPVFMFPYTGGV